VCNEFQEALQRYPIARLEDITDHPLAALLSHELADAIRELLEPLKKVLRRSDIEIDPHGTVI
jgi:hypothetical protein